MKNIPYVLACGLLLTTSTAVFAQTTDDTTTAPAASEPLSGTGNTTGATTDTMDNTTGTTGTTTTTTTDPAATVPSATDAFYQLEQGDMRASELIGMTVYNTAGENIGDINELVVRADGRVAAVVIGVGGFLGLGERNVAVPFEQLQMAPAEGGDGMRISSNLTRDSLTTAPAWNWNAQ